ncbi:SACE_7040 family transcriptional regulator [Gandjariella thermophila]|uniref:TetR family transcriptional regulator n=1 Tax=Gandjariella thermophila TaxID=1931992 RepID=A0A4D4JC39_9PSEU|nr:TetR/AcrR family transcriptional regulator [Gandjariella thermophila]GDY32228.1 TetR family transcriptional regulator [Gandjariella thermophila]
MPFTSAGGPPAAKPHRRDQILNAAAGLFARHGFHGVGIDEIGAAVGVSGPALYRHFRNKDAMLSEMLTSVSEHLLEAGQRTVEAAAGDAEAALHRLVRFHVDFALDNPSLISVQARNLANLTEPDQRRVRGLQRRYVEVWVEAIRKVHPDLDEPTARAAAHAVFGLINSTPHSRHLDRDQMAALLYRMAVAAIAAPDLPSARLADDTDLATG